MKEIFKVQISLNGPEPKMMLVYNKNRTSNGQFEADAKIMKLMGKESKKFFYGEHPKTGPIQLGEEAPWQGW